MQNTRDFLGDGGRAQKANRGDTRPRDLGPDLPTTVINRSDFCRFKGAEVSITFGYFSSSIEKQAAGHESRGSQLWVI